MDPVIYYLVDPRGKVYTTFEAASFEDVARRFGLAEGDCHAYRFDLSTRRLIVDRATPASAIAVQDDVNRRFGSADRLMQSAKADPLPKSMLAGLLRADARGPFLNACAQIERRYTEACAAKGDPCLASGCSVVEGDEICLQPLLAAGAEYRQGCAAEWLARFGAPANRIDAWQQ